MRQIINAYRSQIKYTVIGPYLALMILVMLVGSFIAITLVADSWQERFNNQLGQVARNFTQSFAQREIGNITFLGQISFTAPNVETGAPAVAQAMRERNEDGLELALKGLWQLGQVNENVQPDRLIVFDPQGQSIIDWERSPNSPTEPTRYLGTNLAGIPLVDAVLRGESTPIPGTNELGDKYSGLISFRNSEGQDYVHFFTVAPVYLTDRATGEELLVGGLLVAQRLDTLLGDLQQRSQAAISTIFDVSGIARASTVAGIELPTLNMSDQLLAQVSELNAPRAQPTSQQALGTATPAEAEDPCIDIGLLSGRLASPVEQTRLPACSVNTVAKLAGRDFQLVYAPLLIRGVQSGYFAVGLSTDFVVSAWSSSRSAVIGITTVLALATVVVGVVVARRITRPLENLVETAEAVTAGDLQRRSSVVASNELGRLAQAFNQMTEHLLRLYVASRELNRTIEVDQVLAVASAAASQFVPDTEALALLETVDGFIVRARPAAPAYLHHPALQLAPDAPLITALASIDAQQIQLARIPAETAHAAGLTEGDVQTCYATPIFRQRQFAGALLFVHTAPDAFDESNEPSLAVVANMAAAVLANAVLYSQVQRDATQRQAILSSIGDGVVVCDDGGRIVQLNRAAEVILGLRDWHAGELRFADLPLEPVPQSRELFGGSDAQFRLGQRFVTLTRSPLIAEEGSTTGEVIVLHDITEAAAVDKAKTDFIATISHELRTPLTVIRGFTELLLRGTGGEKLTPDQADLLEQVRARAVDMTDMVNNAILIADIESGQLRTELQPQDLEMVLNMALAPLRPAFAAKQLDVVVKIPPELPAVLADREQLQRALGQILDNARRYTETGGVTVEAAVRDGRVQIDITDTGSGIAPEVLPRLFTRFQRVEGNSSTQRGSGLGLAITRQLIERQGGAVHVRSTPGRGSTFSLTLQQANEHTLAVAQSNASTTTP
ncbi:MAG: HAMP domain-containing protein [Chloroflexi bacterium]|nr:HAMP domain-containing protein [Chloroflexota bacterium]